MGATADGALLAIDAGSSRTRVTLVAADGQVIASAAAPAPSERDGAGGTVMSGDKLWDQVTGLASALLPGDVPVAGIGVAAQLGIVLVDVAGRPTTDVLLWPDQRAAGQARDLSERLGPLGALVGRQVSAELPAAKLLWLARHHAEAVKASRWVLALKDFLVMCLTGAAVTDETHASYTGWYDVAARAYSEELIRLGSVPARLLPPARPAHEIAGTLHEAAAKRLRLADGIPVAVGGPDGSVGALGVGAIQPGVTVDIAGTTDVLLHVVAAPRWDPSWRAALNAFVLPGCWTLGGPTGMTGGAVEWAARLLGFESASAAGERLGVQALALPPGCDGVSFSPALSGSRFPAWNGEERGLLAGLESRHGPAHVFRAAFEGAAFTVLEGIDALRAAGVSVDEVTIAGGLSRLPDLARLRGQLWGLPVRVAPGGEATTTGAAMLAGVAAGVFADFSRAALALAGPAVEVPHDGGGQDAIRALQRWQAAAGAARVLG